MNCILIHWRPVGLIMGMVIFASTLAHPEPQTRTITRTEDFVIFTGANVNSLIGSQVGDLHLFAYSASGLRAIPFQVDKRDAEGRFVFPESEDCPVHLWCIGRKTENSPENAPCAPLRASWTPGRGRLPSWPARLYGDVREEKRERCRRPGTNRSRVTAERDRH